MIIENKNKLLGQNFLGGVDKRREIQAVSIVCTTYELCLLCFQNAMSSKKKFSESKYFFEIIVMVAIQFHLR